MRVTLVIASLFCSTAALAQSGVYPPAGGSGSGTITSVGSIPNVATATTTTGAVTFAQVLQAANCVMAGPSSGTTTAAPTCRSLVPADLSGLTLTNNTSGTAASLTNSAATNYLYDTGNTDTYALHTFHIGTGYNVLMTSNLNSTNVAYGLKGFNVGIGTVYNQMTVEDAEGSSINQVGFYLNVAPNSPTAPTNANMILGIPGLSLPVSSAYGFSSQATGAGTANSALTFRSQISNPSATSISFDTTTAGNGLATAIAQTFQGALAGNVTGNVTGNVAGTLTGAVLAPAGTAAAPSIAFSGSNTDGAYSSGTAGDWDLEAGGVAAFRMVQSLTADVIPATYGYCFGSTGVASPDTCMWRTAASTFAFGNNTAGNNGASLNAKYITSSSSTRAGYLIVGVNNATGTTPVINPTSGGMYSQTLTANTTPTVTGIAAGQHIVFEICQAASGGPYTWTWPAAFHSATAIPTTAGTCLSQAFNSFNGTTFIAENGGLSGVAP